MLTACHADERRQIAGRNESVGELMIAERGQLLPLAEEGFELAEIAFPRVDGLGCVRVPSNLYSVPAAPGKTVEVRLYPNDVEIRDEGRCLARHMARARPWRKRSRWAAPMRRPSAIWWMRWSWRTSRGALIEVGELSRFERPLPVLTAYDGLRDQAVAS
ncbi:MAG: Mu transposase domain-containing protein [Candidatus Binataceae bacterium]